MCHEKRPPGVAAHIGRGVHGAIEHDLKQKIVTRENIPKKDLAEIAAEKYDENLRKDGVFIKREEKSEAGKLLGDGKDNAVAAAESWHDAFAEEVMPRLVERRVTIQDPKLEVPLLGILDTVDEDLSLREWKTGGPRSKWNQQRVDDSNQFTLYHKMVEVTLGSPPTDLITNVIKYGLKSGCTTCTLRTTREPSDYDALIERILHMQQRVFAGMFGPADADSWMCSPNWCGYWWSCRYIPEHRRRIPNV